MAEVVVKKRGRPKKVAVATEDEGVIVRVLEAEDRPTTVTSPTAGQGTSATKKSRSKAVLTATATATTSTGTAAAAKKKTTTTTTTATKTKESTGVPAEGKKAATTNTMTATTTTRKRAVKSSGLTGTAGQIDSGERNVTTLEKANSRGENVTTAQTDADEQSVTTPEKKIPAAEARSFTAESKKLPAQEDASVLSSAPRSATAATTSTVVKSTKTTPTSATKAKETPQQVQASARADGEAQGRARLSAILQQAQAFSKHSDDLHRSLLELVGERERGSGSVASSSSTAATTITVAPVAATAVSGEPKQEQVQESHPPAVTIAIATNGDAPEVRTQLEIGLKDVQTQQVPASAPVSETAAPPPPPPPPPQTETVQTVSISHGPEEIVIVDQATLNANAESSLGEIKADASPEEANGVETKVTAAHPTATAPTIYISSASMPLPTPQSWWSRPRYVLPSSTVTALAARGINTNTTQQQVRQPTGSGSGGDSTSGRGGVSLPSHGPRPPLPTQPKRPSEMPLDKLKKDPKYRELSRRWTTIMVALPVAIVSSYVLWERYQEQQAYRKAKEAKDRLGLVPDQSS